MTSSMRRRLKHEQGGFTLIELLVVIIIIGILLAIAVPSYLKFSDRANEKAALANVRAILPSIESYYSDKSTYDGMTIAYLKGTYDQSISTGSYTLTEQNSTYCIAALKNGKQAKKLGPSGDVLIVSPAVACPASS